MCFSTSKPKFPEVEKAAEKAPPVPAPALTEQVALTPEHIRRDQALGSRIGLSRLVVPIERQVQI